MRVVGNKISKKQEYRDSLIIGNIINKCDFERDYEGALDLFIKRSDKLSNVAYWETLRAVWIACGGKRNYQVFKKLFRADRDCQCYLMTAYDWVLYNKLPENITVYRAAYKDCDDGISWTTSKKFAENYAKTRDREVVSKKIKKIDIFAYFNSRNEEEVILRESLAKSPIDQLGSVLK